jgi:hypothetical protein
VSGLEEFVEAAEQVITGDDTKPNATACPFLVSQSFHSGSAGGRVHAAGVGYHFHATL